MRRFILAQYIEISFYTLNGQVFFIDCNGIDNVFYHQVGRTTISSQEGTIRRHNCNRVLYRNSYKNPKYDFYPQSALKATFKFCGTLFTVGSVIFTLQMVVKYTLVLLIRKTIYPKLI